MMNRLLAAFAVVALAPAPAALAAAPAQTAPAKHYTTAETPIGALLDNPDTKAVLAKYAPRVVQSPQIDAVRDRPLKYLQQYDPTGLSDAVLQQIDAELYRIPVK